jgi:hypothetical protein
MTFKKGNVPWNKLHPCSEETRQKIREKRKLQVFSGETMRKLSEARKGKPKSEEHRRKLSESNRGKHNASEETRRKQSESHKGIQAGELNPRYSGGKAAYIERRRHLGFIPLNQESIGSQAHHLDSQHVVYVPKHIHRSMYHSLKDSESMEKINTKVYCSLLGAEGLL